MGEVTAKPSFLRQEKEKRKKKIVQQFEKKRKV